MQEGTQANACSTWCETPSLVGGGDSLFALQQDGHCLGHMAFRGKTHKIGRTSMVP